MPDAVDIRVRTSLRTHPKWLQLRSRLGAEAQVALLCLWLFAREHRQDGNLDGLSKAEIAMASGWRGRPERLIEALVDLRWLDASGDGALSLHGWAEHNPFAASAEERSRKARENAGKRWSRRRGGDAGGNAKGNADGNADGNAPSPSPPSPSVSKRRGEGGGGRAVRLVRCAAGRRVPARGRNRTAHLRQVREAGQRGPRGPAPAPPGRPRRGPLPGAPDGVVPGPRGPRGGSPGEWAPAFLTAAEQPAESHFQAWGAGRFLLRCPPGRALMRPDRRGEPPPDGEPAMAKTTKKAAPKKGAKSTKKTPAKAAPKAKAPAPATPPAPAKAPAPVRERDPRLPRPGGILTRTFQGKEIRVEVLDAGFAYDGKTWRSLSGIAKAVSGTPWNGYLFFGLQKRVAKPAPAATAEAK